MGTECDRFASIIDDRFKSVAYYFEVGDPERVPAAGEYILSRHLRAEPDHDRLVRNAIRLLNRHSQSLFPEHDDEISRFRASLVTNPGFRIREAFDAALESRSDFITIYADRCNRWMQGEVAARHQWEYIKDSYVASSAEIAKDLALRIRQRALGEPTKTLPKPAKRPQTELLEESVPVRR